jgi:hypothetical protein
MVDTAGAVGGGASSSFLQPTAISIGRPIKATLIKRGEKSSFIIVGFV